MSTTKNEVLLQADKLTRRFGGLVANQDISAGKLGAALVAALIVGFADTFGKVLVPELSGIVVYVVMAVVLLWRPEGILKKG